MQTFENSNTNPPKSRGKKNKKLIYVIATNPKETPRLRFDEEIKKIEEGLERSKLRHEFELKPKLASRYSDLRRVLLDNRPYIVHFIGHGKHSGLMFEGEDENGVYILPQILSELFEILSDGIEAVILNACYSESQAKAIASHVHYVIGMSDKIPDNGAIEFSIGFYDALVAGRSIEDAYRIGNNAFLSKYPQFAEKLIPVIYKKQT